MDLFTINEVLIKDFTGNKKSVHSVLGASNHSETERQINDFYATPVEATEMLLELETPCIDVWESACGEGHISKTLIKKGFKVKSTDLVDRGFGSSGVNFLQCTEHWSGDIITNPPYKFALEFVLKSLELVGEGQKVFMFLKLQFVESKGRKHLFISNPPKTIYVSSSRISCAKNADFITADASGGAVAYAWYVWQKGFTGSTELKWFN